MTIPFITSFDDPSLILGFISFLFILFALPFAFWGIASNRTSSFVKVFIAISNLTLASQLTLRWLQSGHFPVSNLYESLCFLTWTSTLLQLLIERNYNSPVIPALFTPFSLLTISFASFALPEQLQLTGNLVPALRSSWLVMHVTVIMCSYAALMLGSLLSLAVLFTNVSEELQIRGSSIGIGGFKTNFSNLTKPLVENSSKLFSDAEYLDNLSYRIITLGFLLLTFGLISGAVWANEAWGTWWSWDPKETWALISWLVYAAYLHARITKGWQGRKPALIALFGLFVVIICYLGVNLLGIGLHSYGWFLS
ncbi:MULTISPECIES: c-type cytochrome biogenesis protein CcsB [Prochlorococcus]|uniref:c-type cytochrome biogenesis protein CcsB n=1 Tax=Prochlorococcus TaxID=1218 RepID=UPI0005623471|nr:MULTISPECIES: c-type cytochrome biogenesis protein CcsB [Prochlorococcus]